MSKTTKIIAALGVVAGLGVAALPAFTFAESTTGDVDVIVEVSPAIAMTITGNNDNSSHYGTQAGYQAVAPLGTENPASEGWYERSGEAPDYTYTLTSDTTVEDGKTYYEAVESTYNPVDSFNPIGAASSSVDGHLTPPTSITGTSSSWVSMMPNALANTKSTVTVYTNNTNGYTLAVRANNSANMVQQDVLSGADSILPMTTDAPAVGKPGWAFKVAAAGEGTHAGSVQGTYDQDTAMTTSDQTIVSSTSKTSGGDEWDVTYDVATRPDQANGFYKVNLTYTAATRNGS